MDEADETVRSSGAGPPGGHPVSSTGSARIETLLRRKLISVGADSSVRKVSQLLAVERISAAVVMDEGAAVGIFTKTDLCRMVGNAQSAESRVGSVMSRPILSIDQRRSASEALQLMLQHGHGHLLVTDGEQPVGIVSKTDLAGLIPLGPAALRQLVGEAGSVARIADLRQEGLRLATEQYRRDGQVLRFARYISELNDCVLRRLIVLALKDLEAQGKGGPPVEFAWLGMGSEARRTQTIVTDQDNALIFASIKDASLRQAATDWFLELARAVTTALNECGVPFCAGNTMATNPDLCRPLDSWESFFGEIIGSSDDDVLLKASIYFDFRCIYGSCELADQLRGFLLPKVHGDRVFFRRYAENILRSSAPPVSQLRWKLFPHLNLPPPPLDVKLDGLIPLEGSIRLLSLFVGSEHVNTMDRVLGLEADGTVSGPMARSVRISFEYLLRLRVDNETILGRLGTDDHNLVDVQNLALLEFIFLKHCLITVRDVQRFAHRYVGGIRRLWGFM